MPNKSSGPTVWQCFVVSTPVLQSGSPGLSLSLGTIDYHISSLGKVFIHWCPGKSSCSSLWGDELVPTSTRFASQAAGCGCEGACLCVPLHTCTSSSFMDCLCKCHYINIRFNPFFQRDADLQMLALAALMPVLIRIRKQLNHHLRLVLTPAAAVLTALSFT